MSSRCVSLLPWTTLHSESEHKVLHSAGNQTPQNKSGGSGTLQTNLEVLIPRGTRSCGWETTSKVKYLPEFVTKLDNILGCE